MHSGGKVLSLARNNIPAANTKAAKSRRSNGEEDSEDSSSGSSSDSSSGSSSDSSSTDDSDGSSMTRRDINVAKKKKNQPR